jgi:hypothetical protein
MAGEIVAWETEVASPGAAGGAFLLLDGISSRAYGALDALNVQIYRK